MLHTKGAIMLAVVIVALLLFQGRGQTQASVPRAWEHGWETPYVHATRYQNARMGYNIGFVFPRHCHMADSGKLFAFLAAHGGHIYQGGGARCAEVFATFDGVTNEQEANAMLQVLLPDLEAFLRRLQHE